MADVSDVLNNIASLIGAVLYPSGVTSPPTVPPQKSAFGMPVRIFPGWPVAEQLTADMAAGICNVSVYPLATEKNTTRYPWEWQTVSTGTPTLTLTASGQTVTVGGTIPSAGNTHNLAVFVNGIPYLYQVLTTDTLTSIATALKALIVAAVAGTTSSGPVITLPAGARIGACRVGITGTSAQELRRQERIFRITVWADTPAHRDAIAAPIDVALAALTFLTLPDQFAARIRYDGSPMTDMLEKSGIYRRDLHYAVEYPTTQTTQTTQVIAVQTTVQAQMPDSSEATVVTINS